MAQIDNSTSRSTNDPTGRVSATAIDAVTGSNAGRDDPKSWPSFMDQDGASAFLLHECGVRLAPKSLQKRRVVGGSPPFQKIGSRVAYPRDQLKAWGNAQASPVVHSTSELSAG